MKRDSANVLITSVGRRGQLVRAFLKLQLEYPGEVFAADASPLAPGAYLANKAFVVPPIHSDTYIDALLELCESQSVRLLVPTIDTELMKFSLAKSEFEKIGVHVLVSSPECIGISSDKWETNRWLRHHGFPVPEQWTVEQAKGTVKLPLPVFCKPVSGSRSVGARKIEFADDLKALNSKEDLIVQEFIEGDEYTVSTFVDVSGRCLSAVPRKRVEVRDGEVSKAVTRHLPSIEDTCMQIVEQLPGARGPLNVQLISNQFSGEYHVIEINPRFGGGDPLAWEAGANAPKWAVMEALGITPDPASDWKRDLAMLRFDDAIFTELK